MKTGRICIPILFTIILGFVLNPIHGQGLWTVQLKEIKTESRNGNVQLRWKTESEDQIMQYEIEYSQDGRYFQKLGFIPAANKSNGDYYEFEHPVQYTDSVFYRLRIVDRNGRWLYTDPVLFRVNKITAFFVYPSVINTQSLDIYVKDPFDWLEVVSMNGNVMLKENLSGKTGRIRVPLSLNLASGMYVVQLGNHREVITQKIIIQ